LPAAEHDLNLNTPDNGVASSRIAPFRLLVFGDPQLEGDTSLPDPSNLTFPSLQTLWTTDTASLNFTTILETIQSAVTDFCRRDIPLLLSSYRKQLDLLGNDYYLAHIYRTLHWWSSPTHVAVLGDLLGSQWISDAEFARRAHRYWTRVYANGKRIDNEITEGGRTEVLGADPAWATRIINVAGNHDIGYAGDITPMRMLRFEDAFGRTDWDVRFQLPNTSAASSPLNELYGPPELRLVVLNSMNIDGPAQDDELQGITYEFINSRVIGEARPVEDTRSVTILLTHVPLHKKSGVCVDGPLIKYWPHGTVQEQNHLSSGASRGILKGIFGMSGSADAPMNGRGRNGLILTGHDHEGCDVWHHIPPVDIGTSGTEYEGEEEKHDDGNPWDAARFTASDDSLPRPGIREITVRSMMGAYGGNTGLLSGWFDNATQTWQFEYATCPIGVQHYWWAVHVLDVVVALLGVAWVVIRLLERETDTTVINVLLRKEDNKSAVAIEGKNSGVASYGSVRKRKAAR